MQQASAGVDNNGMVNAWVHPTMSTNPVHELTLSLANYYRPPSWAHSAYHHKGQLMEITDSYQLGIIFTAVALITMVTIIVGSRWPEKKDHDD